MDDTSKDPFEEQVNGLRHEMDTDELDIEASWTGIHHRLPKKQNNRRIWYAAASVVLVAAIGWLLIPKEKPKEWIEYRGEITVGSLSPELAKLEEEYQLEISSKWEAIDRSAVDSAELQFILDELELLEELSAEYQNDLQELGPNEKIIQTILKCYERKIQLLDQLTREFSKPKKEMRNEFDKFS